MRPNGDPGHRTPSPRAPSPYAVADPRSHALDESAISDLSDLYHQDEDASRLVRAGTRIARPQRTPARSGPHSQRFAPSTQAARARAPPRVSSLNPRPPHAVQRPQVDDRSWHSPPAPARGQWSPMEAGLPARDTSNGQIDLEKAFPATYGHAADAYATNAFGARQPLINRVTNEWQHFRPTRPRAWSDAGSIGSDENDDDLCITCLNLYASRICRRYLLVFVILIFLLSYWWVRYWGPEYGEKARLKASVHEALEREKGFWGINVRASFPGLDAVKPLERSKVPGSKVQRTSDQPKTEQRRLIVIGDIHGCIDELKALLARVKYNPDTDHIIATGDMVARGPASAEVVSLLMQHNASCVRGNHEERLVLTRHGWVAPTHHKVDIEGVTASEPLSKGLKSDIDLAASLSDEQALWLRRCPLVLDLGPIPGLGRTAVAHAGIVPLVPLHLQDPYSVQTMRGIDIRTHTPVKDAPPGTYKDPWADPNGPQYVTVRPTKVDRYNRPYVVPWTKLWDVAQAMLPTADRTTVIYGHDENMGVTSSTWSVGLDAGCVRGGELAALVLSGTVGGSGRGDAVDQDNGHAGGWTVPGTGLGDGMSGAIDAGVGKIREMGGRVKGIALGVVGLGVRREVVKVQCKKYANAGIGVPSLGDS